MSASFHWIGCLAPTGEPDGSRSDARAMIFSAIAVAMPTACEATARLAGASTTPESERASSGSPIRKVCGTWALSKRTVATPAARAPKIASAGPISRPGVSRGTRSQYPTPASARRTFAPPRVDEKEVGGDSAGHEELCAVGGSHDPPPRTLEPADPRRAADRSLRARPTARRSKVRATRLRELPASRGPLSATPRRAHESRPGGPSRRMTSQSPSPRDGRRPCRDRVLRRRARGSAPKHRCSPSARSSARGSAQEHRVRPRRGPRNALLSPGPPPAGEAVRSVRSDSISGFDRSYGLFLPHDSPTHRPGRRSVRHSRPSSAAPSKRSGSRRSPGPVLRPRYPAWTILRKQRAGAVLRSPSPSCSTSMMSRQTSSPMKSARVSGPIGWFMPSFITVSMSSRRGDALHQAEDRLVDHRHQDAVGDEAGVVLHRDRRLPELPRQLLDRRCRSRRRWRGRG